MVETTAVRWEPRLIRAEAMATRAEPDDVALVNAFRAGDRAAFETLVRRHQRPVWTIVLRFAKDRDAAEDLAQRVFIIALERVSELRGAFRPWLLRIAVNLSKNHIRDTARLVRVTDDEDGGTLDVPVESRPDEALDQARQSHLVRSAVAELPARQREVVQLRVDAQLSFAEVGEALGITENNAKVTYHHAVKKLREKLGNGRATMKACDDRLIDLMDAVDGTPTPELSRHVASCEGCRAELKALRRTEALLRDTSAHPDDFSLSGFAYRVADRAETFRDRSPRGLWWSLTRAMRVTVGFSASALAFAAVLFVSARHVTPSPIVEPAIQTKTASVRAAPKAGEDALTAEVDQMISADRGEPDISLDSGLAGMSADELDELAQQLDTDSAG